MDGLPIVESKDYLFCGSNKILRKTITHVSVKLLVSLVSDGVIGRLMFSERVITAQRPPSKGALLSSPYMSF